MIFFIKTILSSKLSLLRGHFHGSLQNCFSLSHFAILQVFFVGLVGYFIIWWPLQENINMQKY